MAGGTPKVISSEPLSPQDSKWITLVKLKYQDVDGKVRPWEAAERKTRPKNSEVDAVHIVAVIQRPTGPELLLVKQFRPPLDKVCVELPAGLVDEGETVEQCAVRELAEETGYIGEAITEQGGNRPILFGAPGFSNSCSVMVHLNIDVDKEENRNPKPRLEEGEFVETFSVPVHELHEFCRKWQGEGLAIDGKLGSLVEGIQFAKTWQS